MRVNSYKWCLIVSNWHLNLSEWSMWPMLPSRKAPDSFQNCLIAKRYFRKRHFSHLLWLCTYLSVPFSWVIWYSIGVKRFRSSSLSTTMLGDVSGFIGMLIEILKKKEQKLVKKRQHIVDEKVFCKISIVKKTN